MDPGQSPSVCRFPSSVARRARLAALCTIPVFVLTAMVTVMAQQPPPPPPPDGQMPAADDQSRRPDFTTIINLVTTDAIPRDSNGQFVADLKKEDFTVMEDGVEQQVASLTLVHGGRYFNLAAPPPAPVEEGMVLPPPRPVNDAAGRIFVLYVDDLHLDFRNTPRIRDLFKKVATTLIHDGDMFSIVSTGPSSLAIDPTYDRKRLDEAIKKISGSGLKPNDILEGSQGSQGPSEVRYRAHVAFSTAFDLMRQLEKIQNRRKAFIYVSNGYDFDPFPQGRMQAQAQLYGYGAGVQGADTLMQMGRQGQQFADADLARELADLTRAANRANVTMYTIDPRGLVGGADIDEQVDMMEWNNYLRKSQDSLRVLAEETGGTAIVNQNDFDRALKRIDAETSDYYVLGYYSTNPDPTRKHRAIQVKVERDNINVWARKGYSLRTPGELESTKP